jgi:nicotinamidase-related amidase
MDSSDALPHGPLTERTFHLCLDMQNVFAEETPWHMPWMTRVLPRVVSIAERHPQRTIFTRFIPATSPDEMPGTWKRYYERWRDLTLERIDPRLIELVPPLARLVPPAIVANKRFYSPFSEAAFIRLLRKRGADGLIVTGAETDVCVLAATLGAIDHGYRVVLAADAISSSSDETHDALLAVYRRRFYQQVEVSDTETILGCWL